jgi:hypothetical protein
MEFLEEANRLKQAGRFSDSLVALGKLHRLKRWDDQRRRCASNYSKQSASIVTRRPSPHLCCDQNSCNPRTECLRIHTGKILVEEGNVVRHGSPPAVGVFRSRGWETGSRLYSPIEVDGGSVRTFRPRRGRRASSRGASIGDEARKSADYRPATSLRRRNRSKAGTGRQCPAALRACQANTCYLAKFVS